MIKFFLRLEWWSFYMLIVAVFTYPFSYGVDCYLTGAATGFGLMVLGMVWSERKIKWKN
uniref:Uncharacterized protein n=1 Tax=Arsenophonus endosymbiont of Trialeurodes vaporariorum TaxID=235567 RepID=A0A3B0LZ93_9GAMM